MMPTRVQRWLRPSWLQKLSHHLASRHPLLWLLDLELAMLLTGLNVWLAIALALWASEWSMLNQADLSARILLYVCLLTSAIYWCIKVATRAKRFGKHIGVRILFPILASMALAAPVYEWYLPRALVRAPGAETFKADRDFMIDYYAKTQMGERDFTRVHDFLAVWPLASAEEHVRFTKTVARYSRTAAQGFSFNELKVRAIKNMNFITRNIRYHNDPWFVGAIALAIMGAIAGFFSGFFFIDGRENAGHVLLLYLVIFSPWFLIIDLDFYVWVPIFWVAWGFLYIPVELMRDVKSAPGLITLSMALCFIPFAMMMYRQMFHWQVLREVHPSFFYSGTLAFVFAIPYIEKWYVVAFARPRPEFNLWKGIVKCYQPISVMFRKLYITHVEQKQALSPAAWFVNSHTLAFFTVVSVSVAFLLTSNIDLNPNKEIEVPIEFFSSIYSNVVVVWVVFVFIRMRNLGSAVNGQIIFIVFVIVATPFLLVNGLFYSRVSQAHPLSSLPMEIIYAEDGTGSKKYFIQNENGSMVDFVNSMKIRDRYYHVFKDQWQTGNGYDIKENVITIYEVAKADLFEYVNLDLFLLLALASVFISICYNAPLKGVALFILIGSFIISNIAFGVLLLLYMFLSISGAITFYRLLKNKTSIRKTKAGAFFFETIIVILAIGGVAMYNKNVYLPILVFLLLEPFYRNLIERYRALPR